MTGLSKVEPLRPEHDTDAFDCGRPELNSWLARRALTAEREETARTYVVLRAKRVAGYFAMAAGSVGRAKVPGKVRRNSPEPVPVILIARLAVDLAEQHKGLGAALLKDALIRSATVASTIGARAILVHAMDPAACSFYEHLGFERSPVDDLQLFLAMSDLRRSLR